MQHPTEAIAAGLRQARESYLSDPAGDPGYSWETSTGWDDGWSADRVVVARADPIPSDGFAGRAREAVSVWVVDVVSVLGPAGGPVSAPTGPNRPVPGTPPNARYGPQQPYRRRLVAGAGGFASHEWEDGSVTFLVAMPDEPPWVR